MIAIRYFVCAGALETVAAVDMLVFASTTSDVITALSQLVISLTGLVVALVGLWRTIVNEERMRHLAAKQGAVEQAVATAGAASQQALAESLSQSGRHRLTPTAPEAPPPPPPG